MSKSIPLTKGQSAVVDEADYPILTQYSWFYSKNGYARRTEVVNGKRKFIYMHREIMQAQRGELVDHIDGNRLNNTRDNLRIVTRNQNMWNCKKRKDANSGYKGVSKHRLGWQVRIRYRGQRIHLGYFEHSRFGAKMYDAAARHLFGEYAQLNLPQEPTPPHLQKRLEAILNQLIQKGVLRLE